MKKQFKQLEVGAIFSRPVFGTAIIYKKVSCETMSAAGTSEIIAAVSDPDMVGKIVSTNRNHVVKVHEANPITLVDKLVASVSSHARDAAIAATSKEILNQESKGGGVIVQTVKEACARCGIPFRRTSAENQFSTNLIFNVGTETVRFDYCGGAMMRQACGQIQMMALVAAFAANFPLRTLSRRNAEVAA